LDRQWNDSRLRFGISQDSRTAKHKNLNYRIVNAMRDISQLPAIRASSDAHQTLALLIDVLHRH
jgi:hypothetical protein